MSPCSDTAVKGTKKERGIDREREKDLGDLLADRSHADNLPLLRRLIRGYCVERCVSE